MWRNKPPGYYTTLYLRNGAKIMKESENYLKNSILKKLDNLLVMLNAIVAWGLFHYTVYLAYSAYKFITG